MTLRGATFVDGCDLIWKCRTIKSAAEVEALEAEGMGSTIEMAGHGVGLNPQEPPMIAEEEESVFEEGMVIAVEAWVVDWTGTGLATADLTQIIPEVFGNEDYVVVTKDGCDRFPSFRKDLRSLPFEG